MCRLLARAGLAGEIRSVVVAVLGVGGFVACTGQTDPGGFERFSAAELDAHLRFLASDALGGRAPGTPGAQLAAMYVAHQFELAGLEPAVGDSGFFQPVSLVGVTPSPTLWFRARGGARFEPGFGPEYVARSGIATRSTSLEAELVFAGHGIVAPDGRWNDYKDVDVRGQVLLMLVGEPGDGDPTAHGPGDDNLRSGSHWRHRLEEARRRGALGVLLVHTEESAGYSWKSVRSVWMAEQLRRPDELGRAALRLEGWLAREAAEHLIAMAGLDFPTLLETARSAQFRPISTGIIVSSRIENTLRRFSDRNVVGLLGGSDPQRARELVIYMAHYDHLGIGTPEGRDSIYNGAYDSASGTALLISIAAAFARLPRRPARSILFVALTAEEYGLLGSETYLRSPVEPLDRIVCTIRIDRANLWGRTEDIGVAAASLPPPLWAAVRRAVDAEGLRLSSGRFPVDEGLFESAGVRFARAGIPSVEVKHGLDFIGQQPGWGRRLLEEYKENAFHSPQDEYRSDFDYGGAIQQGRIAFRIGLEAATGEELNR